MESKTDPISATLYRYQIQLLKQWANDEQTTVSDILRCIISEYTMERMEEQPND